MSRQFLVKYVILVIALKIMSLTYMSEKTSNEDLSIQKLTVEIASKTK
jgi:hypothetical protein